MNKKLKAAWIKALRSGEYQQGHYYLQNRDQYCCLGVLCRIAEKVEGFLPKEITGRLVGQELSDQNNSFGLVMRQQNRLMELNDSRDKTFPEIAAWISKNVKVRGARKAKAARTARRARP